MMAPKKIELILLFALFFSCTKDKGVSIDGSEYPKEIASIIRTKCAVQGCHNNISKDAAAGLSLTSWKDLFEGSRGGSVVIPYRPDFSTLCFYTNSFPELGPSLDPKMPVGSAPLSKEDYLSIRQWIETGAPDVRGQIKYSGARNKMYVTNQLCDVVTAIDGESKLPMRYIDVGISPKSEYPVCIKVSPDKRFWYVTFLASGAMQKFDAQSDKYVGKIDLGEGIWSSFEVTADSKYAFCVDNSSKGKIAYVDLEAMKVSFYYNNSNFQYPRAIAINNKLNKMYIGSESGNYISAIDITNPSLPIIKQIILDESTMLNNFSSIDPTSLFIYEPLNICFVACRGSKEIKIVGMLKDSLEGTIFMGASPTEMDYAPGINKLFVSCMDDSLSFPGNTGSVKVLSLGSGQPVKTINSGFQSNGISVNNSFGYVAVVNSNISPKGPKPHHTGACKGRNGYITYINLTTLELQKSIKFELAVYPSAVALRK